MKKYSYKTLTNSLNTSNKRIPHKKISSSTIKTEPFYGGQEIIPNDIIFSKVLSKKKSRGIMDMSSLGNKDVLTDSDSEISRNRKAKNKENNKKMENKKGCAELIIEKVESQIPKKNDYNLVNRKKNIYNNKYNSKLINFNSPPNEIVINFSNNNSNINKNYNQNRGFTNKTIYGRYKTNSNNIINNNNKKLNYSHNKNRNIDDNIYNIIKRRIYDKDKYSFNKYNNSSIGRTNINSQTNNSSFAKSPENSMDKGFTPINFGRHKGSFLKYDSNITNPSFIYYSNNSLNNNSSISLKNNYAPNTKQKKTISSFNEFKDGEIKRPTINQLINLNFNNRKNKNYLQTKFNEKLIKSVIKIQSFWRGAFVRDLIDFFKKLIKLVNTVQRVFKNQKRKNFFHFLGLVKNIEKPKNKRISIGLNVKGRPLRQKYILSKEKNDRIQKKNNDENLGSENTPIKEDSNYNSLLKDYNTLLDKYNELKEKMNEINNKKIVFEKLEVDKKNFEIKNLEKKTENNLDRKNNDNNNETKELKKFDKIKKEQNGDFNIIPKSNNKNIILRGRYLNKKPIFKIEKTFGIEILKDNENKKINYEDYLNHFILNINKYTIDQFFVEQNPNKKVLNINQFYISNNSITLLNKQDKKTKAKVLNPFFISSNSLTLLNKKNTKEKQKIFDNISIDKIGNLELIIINKKIIEEEKNEIKEENKELKIKDTKGKKKKKGKKQEPKEENKNNTNDEKTDSNNNNIKLFKNNLINEHTNQINIISIKKQREFDKDKIILNKDISLDIINQINEIIEKVKKKDILIEEKNENKKPDDILMIDNNNVLYIKKQKKKKCCEKEEIKYFKELKQNEHYELSFNGIKLNKEVEKPVFNKNNFNENNIVEKENEIEINPIEVFKNKNSAFAEKAKENILKIILPIRLKIVLKGYIRKKLYCLLKELD